MSGYTIGEIYALDDCHCSGEEPQPYSGNM